VDKNAGNNAGFGYTWSRIGYTVWKALRGKKR